MHASVGLWRAVAAKGWGKDRAKVWVRGQVLGNQDYRRFQA